MFYKDDVGIMKEVIFTALVSNILAGSASLK